MPTTLPPPGDPGTLYVLDLSGYVFRAYHGLPALSNSRGEPTHATLGVANMLNALVRERKPYYLAVAMDPGSDSESFRLDMYPEYKATRPPAPPDLAAQMDRCRQLAEAYAIPILRAPRCEADDLIAAAVRTARAQGLRVVIGSADKDLMQLVGDGVVMWDAMRNRVYGADEVREKWGVGPERVCDLLALMGDTSDNVPGVPGIGEKTAAKLLTEHGSLDGVYAALDKIKGKLKENLRNHEADARLSYRLVTLDHEVPVTLDLAALRYGGWDPAHLKALYRELEFTKLADAVDAATRAAATAATPAPFALTSAASGTAPAAPAPPTPTTKHYEPVLTTEALAAAVAACRATGGFAVDTETTSIEAPRADLVGVSLAWTDDHGVYIPVGHRVLGDPQQLPRETVLAALRPLLADPAVAKYGQNIKYDDIVLRRAGAPVAGYAFDTMIASYLIDPERHSHKLDEIAQAELGYSMLAYDTVTQKARGKTQLCFDQVDIATAARYSAEDADMAQMLTQRLRPRVDEAGMGELLRNVEIPLALVLGRMEEHGVLVDVGFLRTLSGEVGHELERVEKELRDLVGKDFNVNSPRQLETILFDDLKLPVIKRTKTTRSTDHEVLEELADRHPLPAKILEQRSLSKLKSTYLDTLPTLVNPASGRIHTSYNQAVAATGRLSSNNPNLQNIPIRTEIGRKIRQAFIAPPGCRLFAADYSQIELRVLAHLSRDAILMDAFQRGEDIHTRTAMEIYKVPADQVTRAMRGNAKTTNFAVIYGQGDAALARRLGIEKADAARFIADYFKTFPGLTRFLEEVVQRARDGEGVRTELGRRRFLPDLKSENRGLRAAAERVAKNTPIQGTAADIMKLAMVNLDRALTARAMRTRMILTVHDELVFEVPADEEAAAEALVRETMESAFALRVPLRVDCGWGRSWGEAH